MSENLVPEEFSSDVIEKNEAEEVKEASLNLADKTLAELSELFQGLKDGADSMLRSKEAESIKSAFNTKHVSFLIALSMQLNTHSLLPLRVC